MDEFKIKIVSGGGKLFLYFPLELRNQINFSFGDLVKIIIFNKKKSSSLITKYNYNITLKKEVIRDLNLKKGDLVEIKISKLKPVEKPLSFFSGDLIDMLFFIPEFSNKGSRFYFEVFEESGEEFIRIISLHDRGSSSQISLRRYVDPRILGFLLGQIQSEGTKTNYNSLEFCNKSFCELKDYLFYLDYLGISRKRIFAKLDYHTSFKNSLQRIVSDFEKNVGLRVDHISESSKSRGGYGFKIIVRNVVVSEIFLNALNKMRDFLISESFENLFKTFCEAYLTKILCGDGSFEITSKNRKKFQSRLIIADGNKNYLQHYKILLEKFGFKPKIKNKFGYIRALCNLELANKLLEINAFENNPNRKKLLEFIENNKVFSKKSEA